jgi:hypothetical protein
MILNGHTIIAIGRSLTELADDDPVRYSQIADKLTVHTIFDPAKPEEFELADAAVRCWTEMALKKLPLGGLFTKSDCYLTFPGYDQWPETYRRGFEYALHHNDSRMRLWVNGVRAERITDSDVEKWKSAAQTHNQP